MSKKITNLVITYKQTKDKKILDEILEILNPIIQKKASYIYYKKWYPLNYFNKCKHCQHCKNKNRTICKECKKCICSKGYFNLKKNNLFELSDVKNDLVLKVLELIKQFDVTRDFYTFFGAVLFDWRPSFITQDFIKSFSHQRIYNEIENNEIECNLEDKKESPSTSSLTIEEIFKKCKTNIERQICKLSLDNPNITKEELAEKLGIYKMKVSRIMIGLRKRLKIFIINKKGKIN